MSDAITFPLFQAVIFLAWLHAWVYERGWLRPPGGARLQRGEKTFQQFGIAYGFLALLVTTVNGMALGELDDWKHYSVLVNVLDLAALYYLCFHSSRFRNRIAHNWMVAQEKWETH